MASPRDNFISTVLKSKGRAERGLQSVGRRIGQNISQGQSDFESGKAKYYGTINPFRGLGSAFKDGYGSQ